MTSRSPTFRNRRFLTLTCDLDDLDTRGVLVFRLAAGRGHSAYVSGSGVQQRSIWSGAPAPGCQVVWSGSWCGLRVERVGACGFSPPTFPTSMIRMPSASRQSCLKLTIRRAAGRTRSLRRMMPAEAGPVKPVPGTFQFRKHDNDPHPFARHPPASYHDSGCRAVGIAKANLRHFAPGADAGHYVLHGECLVG